MGELYIPVTIPVAMVGVRVFVQAFCIDLSQPSRLSATNGLEVILGS